ncbi:MAG: family 31 glucosidase, partial [Clostridia bacterium]|nr:family 31 glucosidase [Clostridia bacterium]
MAIVKMDEGFLFYQEGREKIRIEPWGKDSLRVRVTHNYEIDFSQNWALMDKPNDAPTFFASDDGSHSVTNGKITATIDRHGYISFTNSEGKELVREYWRNRHDLTEYCLPLNYCARQFKPIIGGDWQIQAWFESYEDEKFFGLGQYQEKQLNRKGLTLELAQRNSQASIPFMTSTRGYGFLWNNPALGRVALGMNRTEWVADASKQMDYWITAGDTPMEIQQNYTAVTGRVPMMRDDVMGFWQSKLRYRTQNEVLSVAEEYKRRNIPLDVIGSDFFHWTKQGDWMFDPNC